MTTVKVEIVDYDVRPDVLSITVGFPVFTYLRTTHFRRHGEGLADGVRKAWYCNDSQGGLPKQDELAGVLDELVLSHPVLGRVASEYDILP